VVIRSVSNSYHFTWDLKFSLLKLTLNLSESKVGNIFLQAFLKAQEMKFREQWRTATFSYLEIVVSIDSS